jgi:hypothetical protein
MKKFIILSLILMFSQPIFASCPLTGCTVSNWDTTLPEKYVPNKLEELEKPETFKPTYVVPYRDALINTETGKNTGVENNAYNSNCQFGVCLPGEEMEGER